MKVNKSILVFLLVTMNAYFLTGMDYGDANIYSELPDPDSMLIRYQTSHDHNLKGQNPVALYAAITAMDGKRVQVLFQQGEWLGGSAHPSTVVLLNSPLVMRKVITQIILQLPYGKDKIANISRLLWVLSEIGDWEAISIFFERTPPEIRSYYLSQPTYNGHTPLGNAVIYDHSSVLENLIEELGADIDTQPVPLKYLAAYYKRKEILEYLVKKIKERAAAKLVPMVV
jgi:hypothetical protein